MLPAESQPTDAPNEPSYVRLIGFSIAAKLLIDTGHQIFSPFLAVIAAGLGTDVIVLGRLVGLRSAMGLTAPIFGAFADRNGYRRVLRLALLLTAVGMVTIGLSRSLAVFAVGMVVSGVGIAGFVPTLHAYLSARLPYARRARALGIVEYSWAFTGIFGLSAIGWLIAAAGWRAPFLLLALGLLAMSFAIRALPAARDRERESLAGDASQPRISAIRRMRRFFDLGHNAVSAYSAIGGGALIYLGAMQIMITYGAWLSAEYGLSPPQLGMVALLFGLFDLTASVSVSLFTDRIGKRRAVLIGTAGALIGYVLVPFFNQGVVSAVLGIAFARGCFEFAIVSNFPLLSEQVPDQRGKVMTLAAAVSLSAATAAGFSGPWLYTNFGAEGLAWVSAAITAAALALIVSRVRELPAAVAGDFPS